MRLKVIACEIFYRELCLLMANSPHTCDAEFLPKGLHDLGTDKMLPRLQGCVDAVDAERYDAIALAYGLCNNGIAGLKAPPRLPLVVPRAHDCITLFMGNREEYLQYFNEHPGTYYRTTGWSERDDASGAGEATVSQKLGLFAQYDELVRQYGEDNARYIMDVMGGDGTANYSRLTYIRMGLACEEPFVERARGEAARKGWTFEEIRGDIRLLRQLVDGEWGDADFVTVPPGGCLKASHDAGVVNAVPPACDQAV